MLVCVEYSTILYDGDCPVMRQVSLEELLRRFV